MVWPQGIRYILTNDNKICISEFMQATAFRISLKHNGIFFFTKSSFPSHHKIFVWCVKSLAEFEDDLRSTFLQTWKKTNCLHDQLLRNCKKNKMPKKNAISEEKNLILTKPGKIWLALYQSSKHFTQPLVVRLYLIPGVRFIHNIQSLIQSACMCGWSGSMQGESYGEGLILQCVTELLTKKYGIICVHYQMSNSYQQTHWFCQELLYKYNCKQVK